MEKNKYISNGSFAAIMLVGIFFGITTTAFYYSRYRVMPVEEELVRVKSKPFPLGTIQSIKFVEAPFSDFNYPQKGSTETVYHKILRSDDSQGLYMTLDTGNLMVYTLKLARRPTGLLNLVPGDVVSVQVKDNEIIKSYYRGKDAAEIVGRIEKGELKNPASSERIVSTASNW